MYLTVRTILRYVKVGYYCTTSTVHCNYLYASLFLPSFSRRPNSLISFSQFEGENPTSDAIDRLKIVEGQNYVEAARRGKRGEITWSMCMITITDAFC